ncbi:MAG: 6-pyruvoyl trahydropterin synthase family protein [Flavobacteriales bacterium AspAUS03]
MKVTISRRTHFNAAHRLYNDHWDQTQNEEIFGKCAYPHYHGHNYELIVSITGEVNPQTGFVMSLKELKEIIHREVEEPFDHKNFNLDVEEFRLLNPTTENIVVLIWQKIRKKILEKLALKIILYETPRNFAEYAGE